MESLRGKTISLNLIALVVVLLAMLISTLVTLSQAGPRAIDLELSPHEQNLILGLFDGTNVTNSSDNNTVCATQGYYGPSCLYECHCLDGYEACSSDGICEGNCTYGWSGETCQIPCSNWTYGMDCARNCSSNCKAGICDRATGFCYCREDAPEIDCTPPPNTFESFITSFWLSVCLMTLLTVVCMLCCGSRCTRNSRDKRKALKVNLRRRNGSLTDWGDRKDAAGNLGKKSARYGTPTSTASARRPSTFSRSLTVDAAKGGAASVATVRLGPMLNTDITRASITSNTPNPAVVAKHLSVLMPEYNVKVNSHGQMNLVRKGTVKPFRREDVARIFREKAKTAKANVGSRGVKASPAHLSAPASRANWSVNGTPRGSKQSAIS